MVAHEQSRLLELRQHAVDGSEPDVEPVREELPVDVLGGQVALPRLLEDVDDLEPRQRRLEARVAEVVGLAHAAVRIPSAHRRSRERARWL